MSQKFSQKYTIIQLLENIKDGYIYSSDNWPLHSTVVDTFAIDWSVDEMIAQLGEALGSFASASTRAQGDRYFSESKQTQVTIFNRSESIVKLHLDLLALLEKGGLILNEPQFARDGFLPHATVHRHARLNKGDKVQITALSIIDMFPDKNPYQRKVLKTINIGQ